MRRSRGFSLVELMMVVAIIGIMASIAMPTFATALARAKRVEATSVLVSLQTAQKAYVASGHEGYASTFDELGFSIEGKRISATQYDGKYYAFVISQPFGINSFHCVATGQLDADAWPDVIIIEEGRP
jgi:prepilin-type N-terminal cleavage/methylation domain-containing protein